MVSPLWGVAIGVPGPVEFTAGLPAAPPIMPGWDAYPIRDRFHHRLDAPVWVDNDVNLLALAELRTNPDANQDMVFVKIGTGIGAGLVSGGRLHRGANGSAGDIGHVAITKATSIVCRCGKFGCLESIAGGAALARDAQQLAIDGGSDGLSALLAKKGRLAAGDVWQCTLEGDPASRAC